MGNMSGSYGSHYTLWQSITQNSQDIANNKSNVTVRIYLSFDGSSYYAYTNSATSGSMTINGSTYYYSIPSISFSSGQSKDLLLAEGTLDIQHNDDGTKTLNVSGTWDTGTSRIGSGSCSNSTTLSTIPRKSLISCSTANIEENAVITVTSASSSFKNVVWYNFGTVTGENIATIYGSGTFQWTIPSKLYSMIPNSKTGTGLIVVDTYSGDSFIGESTQTLTINTSEARCKPDIAVSIKDVNEETIALTGDSSKLIKYKSMAYIKTMSTSKNYASIKNTIVNNVLIENNEMWIQNVETETFIIQTTDSRGYSNSITLKPEMIQYIPLTINANFYRPQPTTGEVDLTYSGNYFNNNFGSVDNSLSLKWQYREKETEEWVEGGELTPTFDGNTIKKETLNLGKIFDYQKAYEFQIIAVDKLTTWTSTYQVSVGTPVYNWGKDFFNINGDFRINEISQIPVILYKNGAGTTETVTLTESAANFSKLEITYYYSGIEKTIPITDPNNKYMSLSIELTVGGVPRVQYRTVHIIGNSIVTNGSGYLAISPNGSVGASADENNIFITKVIGYR